MLKRIYFALNVRPEEERSVSLLLIIGFFTGVFLASYQVGAETLFLSRLGNYLEEALMVAGFLGVVTTALFSFMQDRISFSALSVVNALLVGVVCLVFYLSLHFLGQQYQDMIIFIMFSMIGPITAVLLLGFWGVFGRIFDIRQSKRIIGWIDSGQLIAAILTFFIIPLSWRIIGDTDNIFIVGTVSIFLSAVFLLVLILSTDLKKFDQSDQIDGKELKKSASLKNILKDKYLRLLSFFLLFSMLAFMIVQYSFQDAVSKQFPDETELRNFISFFQAFILVFMFFLQTFINDKILSDYGIKVALLILPVVLVLFTGLAIAAGHFFGFSEGEVSFFYFFSAVALSRLFSNSLRDALENPTFKFYFMPLDNRVRFNIQTKIEGIVNESSRFFAGVIILSLSLLPFVTSIHFSYLLGIILIGYIFLIGKIYSEYRTRVRKKLEDQSSDEDTQPEKNLFGKLKSLLVSTSRKSLFSFKLLEKIDPSALGENVNVIMKHEDDIIRDYAQTRMNELKGLSVSEKYIVSYDPGRNEYFGRHILEGADFEELLELGDISQRRILKLSRSSHAEDRLYAAELLINSSNEGNNSILIELLNDYDYNVRITALKASQQKYNNEVIKAVINNLSSSVYSNLAADTLVVIGGKALDTLDATFYKSGQNLAIMIRIIQILGRIGGNKAKILLWNKVDYPNKIIASTVLLALGGCGFKAGISQITNIKYAIESDIGDISWNMAAIGEISEEHFYLEIKQALEEENQYDTEHIYMLLGMLYDPQSILLVKENIESGTNEGVSFALELLDVFLSDELKRKILPVLDDISVSEKAKKLEFFFPRAKFDSNEVLKNLLNRDYTQSNRWTKACVAYQIGRMKIKEYEIDLIAQLFNPDRLLRQVAAWALYQINPDTYFENIVRISEKDQKEFNEIITGGKEYLLLFHKVIFLKELEMFQGASGLVLSELADKFEEVILEEGEEVLFEEKKNNFFYIIYRGGIKVFEFGNSVEKQTGDFISEVFSQHSSLEKGHMKSNERTILFKIYKDNFYDFLAENVRLVSKTIELV